MPGLVLGAHKVVTGLSRSASTSSSSSSNSDTSSSSSTTDDLDDDNHSLSSSPASSIEFGTPPPAYSAASAPAYHSLDLKALSLALADDALLPQTQAQTQTNVLELLFDASHPLRAHPATLLAQGTIVDLPAAGQRTLYAHPATAPWDRDSICDLLELAEDRGCTGVVLPLAKRERALGERLHELLYVGGVVVVGEGGQDWVLVGLDV